MFYRSLGVPGISIPSGADNIDDENWLAKHLEELKKELFLGKSEILKDKTYLKWWPEKDLEEGNKHIAKWFL